MKIGDIDLDQQVYIVAEIGNNHEGSYALAEEMIGRAAETGVDAVKFQTFIPEYYVSEADQGRLERLRKFQLSYEQFERLANYSKASGIAFFSTPFDVESAKFLNNIQAVFKVSSGDNTFFPLIETIAGFGKPVIISTGLTDLSLLDEIYSFWQRQSNAKDLAFLHCVTSYPVPLEQANLRTIATLKSHFPDVTIGYSDHTLGNQVATFAVAAGAQIIEKHFTLDKNFSDFRDHQLSADPGEMRALVQEIRALSKIMGRPEKAVQDCELNLKTAVRRSIAAADNLASGTILSAADLTWVRPGTGLSPGQEDLVVGRKITRSLKKGEVIHTEDLLI